MILGRKSDTERRLLAACADEGFARLDAYFRANPAQAYTAHPFVPVPRAGRAPSTGHLSSSNPDLFYAALSVLHAAPAGASEGLVRAEEARGDMERMVAYLESVLYRETQFERQLAGAVDRFTRMADGELREAFRARFRIGPLSLASLPRDRSIFFAKVNHGYWEYMRIAYDAAQSRPDQFRDIDIRMRVRRLRTSGVTQHWGQVIRRTLARDPADLHAPMAPLCVSLTAGTEPPSVSMRKELGPVTRGAAVGLMAMFEAAMPDAGQVRLHDGGATRSLIFDGTLQPFFESHVHDAEAVVLVVPPHLRTVNLVQYRGSTYRFIVPPTRINECWRTVAASLLGYLARLGERHSSITVLAQGASIASLAGLLLADMDPLPGIRLRYFDLGRVLDVAAPEFVAKQAWAMRNAEAYVNEGRKVFAVHPDPECTLATLL